MVQRLSIALASHYVGVAALVALLAAPALAQTYVGTTSPGAFNTAANWNGGVIPTFDNTTAIVLNSPAATGVVTPPAPAFVINNDRSGVSTLNSLTFSSTGNTNTTYRPITLNATPTTNSLEFAGTNPTIVGNFAGANSNVNHAVNMSVSFLTNTTITASNTNSAANTGINTNMGFGGTGQTFNTNSNTITTLGSPANTVPQGQFTVSIGQTVGGAAKFAVTGGTGSSNGTTAVSGGSIQFAIGAGSGLASGASAEVTLRGGANGTGASAGVGGGSTLQFNTPSSTFTPLVIFSNAGNSFAFKTVALNGNNGTVTGLSSTGQSTAYFVSNSSTTANSVLTINNSANYSYGGQINNSATRTLSLVKNGAGTQTFTGTGTANQLSYTGTTTVNAGVLTFATTVSNTLSGAVTVNGGTLNVGSSGVSVLTLSGGVTVNAGGAFNILPGAVVSAVDINGGTVGGTGTLPAFTLESTAILAPGVGGAGTINAAGLTMDGGSTIAFELNQATPALSDRVALTGAFTKGAAGLYTFDFGTTNLTGANTFDLVTFTGGTTFSASDFALTGLTSATGFNYNVVVTSTAVQLVSSAVAVVPESGTGVLALFGLAMGLTVPVIRRRIAR